jgi:hypothetical protein
MTTNFQHYLILNGLFLFASQPITTIFHIRLAWLTATVPDLFVRVQTRLVRIIVLVLRIGRIELGRLSYAGPAGRKRKRSCYDLSVLVAAQAAVALQTFRVFLVVNCDRLVRVRIGTRRRLLKHH